MRRDRTWAVVTEPRFREVGLAMGTALGVQRNVLIADRAHRVIGRSTGGTRRGSRRGSRGLERER